MTAKKLETFGGRTRGEVRGEKRNGGSGWRIMRIEAQWGPGEVPENAPFQENLKKRRLKLRQTQREG